MSRYSTGGWYADIVKSPSLSFLVLIPHRLNIFSTSTFPLSCISCIHCWSSLEVICCLLAILFCNFTAELTPAFTPLNNTADSAPSTPLFNILLVILEKSAVSFPPIAYADISDIGSITAS